MSFEHFTDSPRSSRASASDLSVRMSLHRVLQPEAPLSPLRTPTIAQSPRKLKPSMSLELSDTDGEIHEHGARSMSPPRVLMVQADAHGALCGDVRVSLVHSPAKVICHTPERKPSPPSQILSPLKVILPPSPEVTPLDSGISADQFLDHHDNQAPASLPTEPGTEDSSEQAPGSLLELIAEESSEANPVVYPSDINENALKEILSSRHTDRGSHDQSSDLHPRDRSSETRGTTGHMGSDVTDSRHTEQSHSASHDGHVLEQHLTASHDHSVTSHVFDADVMSVMSDVSRLSVDTHSDSREAAGLSDHDDRPSDRAARMAALTKKRRKPPRTVQSRYMQPAAPIHKGPMKATDRSVIDKYRQADSRMSAPPAGKPAARAASFNSGLRPRRLADVTAQSAAGRGSHSLLTSQRGTPGERPPAARTSRQKQTPKLSSGVKRSNTFSATPDLRHRSGKMSTPREDARPHAGDVTHGSDVTHLSEGDISAIGALQPKYHSTMLNSPDPEVPEAGDRRRHRSGDSRLKDSVRSHKAQQVTQEQLDFLQVRLAQQQYLLHRVRLTKRQQEKQVKEQLGALYDTVTDMEDNRAGLEQRLATLKHLRNLDDALAVQLEGLAPLVARLPQLQQVHGALSAAVQSTQHRLPLQGVHLPDSQGTIQDDLAVALNETESLLEEIREIRRPQQAAVSCYSDQLQEACDVITNQRTQIERCQRIESMAKRLTTEESSLKIGEMQALEV